MRIRNLVLVFAACALGTGASAQTQAEPETAEPGTGNAALVKAAQEDTANWREVPPENLFIFQTTKGRVLIEAFPEVAPNHYKQFAAIIRSGDYAGTRFHRVIDDFMAQGGDIFATHGRDSGLPDLEGEFVFRRDPVEWKFDLLGATDTSKLGFYKGVPVQTQSEFLAELSVDGKVESNIAHCPGVVSTARTDDPNSGNSGFFLMRGEAPWLDGAYTAWGKMVEGLDRVQSIRTGEPPANPDILQDASIAADLPEEERPRVWVQRTDGPVFHERLLSVVEEDAKLCDFPQVLSIVEG